MSLKGVLNMHLLVAKDCMRKALFLNFSEWDSVVFVTSDCYNNQTSEPILVTFASF